ncbi:MBL fold metallo-hydrolase [Halomicrobium salinisoli]|uniref:MBL fold metallo-hydrolase n=1 Tax=Halomicrobium salinisoli TaxID=2878391 RepID=UPI001CF0095E|nr:MBL fold metallo-hydrolase [Halomicrobium salinisoli]
MDETITPSDLADLIAGGERVGVVDVRDRDEFERWRVEGPGVEVEHVPHARFLQAQVRGGAEDLVDLPEPVVAVCGRGEASGHAADLLRAAGVEAANLEGGTDAWARLYRARELETPDGATVVQYHRPATGCLGYLVVDGDDALVVDPLRAFADRYGADAAARGATLRRAVDTHVHADHVSGVRTLSDGDVTAVVPETARDRGLAFDAETLADGDEVAVGETTVRAVAAPGHTTEMTALLVEHGGPGTLLSGDSLFLESVARPDLESGVDPERAAATLHESVHERLLALPGETLLAPGHVGPTVRPRADGTYAEPLADVAEAVPLLALDREAFVERVTASLPPRPANAGRIVAANLGREDPDEDLLTLEVGPNNCAAT